MDENQINPEAAEEQVEGGEVVAAEEAPAMEAPEADMPAEEGNEAAAA